jgi:hypothetical protein
MVATALLKRPEPAGAGELALPFRFEQITTAAAPFDTGQISNRRSGLLT